MIPKDMRKVALVFALAVIAPSLVLAWLAVRSLRDQQLVVERQRMLLYQGVADGLVQQVQQEIADRQREFAQLVEGFCSKEEPATVAPQFDEFLRDTWPLADVGFVVTLQGKIGCPSLVSRPEARQFLMENDRFLCSAESLEVYWNGPKGQVNLTQLDNKAVSTNEPSGGTISFKKVGDSPVPTEAKFFQLVGDGHEGTIARFLQDQLKLMFWYRSPRDNALVFGAQMRLQELVKPIKELITLEPSLRDNISVALLDDTGKPVAISGSETAIGQRRAFVSSAIGEVLPHWEIAVYLQDPTRLGHAATTVRLTLGLLIAVLVLAIGIGSWLIVTDLRRQLTLTRQKTDFVSNVSHELKTPLTSIRMFSELLTEGKADPAKQRSFLRIIAAESARLTRLVNNVLDFARIERGEKKYSFRPFDLREVIKEVVDAYRPHLEANGFSLKVEAADEPMLVDGDRDALSQVLVNLLSNAEKYSGERKEICVMLLSNDGCVDVRVVDRGMGVPRGCEEKIFDKFYRAHDSLSSGIQGSGLGLTLARQIVRAHHGDVLYEPRDGGGSCFILRLPAKRPES